MALDCAMFMQHNIHSEFHNPKQIASTVRFDAEEALATDISDLAIGFQITSSGEKGSGLIIFTSQRKILSDILLSLQSNNIDPITIEPDVSCLSRFIQKTISPPESQQGATLFGLLSRRRGYFITCPKSQKISIMRTFLVGPTQNRNELLTRQALITTNLTKADEPIDCLNVFDSTSSIDLQQFSDRLSLEASSIDLIRSASVEPQALTDCDDSVDFAIAYGAALAHLDKAQTINFRNDFMPYQGKKRRLERALKFASISFTVLLLALGLYFQTRFLGVNNDRNSLRDKFSADYLTALPGKKKFPDKFTKATTDLGGELRRLENVKAGLSSAQGEESLSLKLTQVLGALNKYASQTDLNIDSVSITTKSISVEGDTKNASSMQKFRAALKQSNMGDLTERITPTKTGRQDFTITIVPKR